MDVGLTGQNLLYGTGGYTNARTNNSRSHWRTVIAAIYVFDSFGSATRSGDADVPGFRPSSGQHAVDTLFRRFAVIVFVVLLRFGAGMVDNAVPVIRRRIKCIELQWSAAGIDDVVIRPSRYEHGETRADHRANAIENGLARPFLHAKELIELVHFHPDLFLGLQRHDNELAVLGRVKHPAKIFILNRDAFNVFYETFHGIFSS
jgi:hypothetical protein